MKGFYKKIAKMNNAIKDAAPQSNWGKGAAWKGGATTNSSISDKMFERELFDYRNRCNKAKGANA